MFAEDYDGRKRFDAGASLQAKNSAALLAAATNHLGSLLADLYVAMPSLASCGFVASLMGKYSKESKLHLASTRGQRSSLEVKAGGDASTAMAAISEKLGVDMQALAALVSDAESTFAGISR